MDETSNDLMTITMGKTENLSGLYSFDTKSLNVKQDAGLSGIINSFNVRQQGTISGSLGFYLNSSLNLKPVKFDENGLVITLNGNWYGVKSKLAENTPLTDLELFPSATDAENYRELVTKHNKKITDPTKKAPMWSSLVMPYAYWKSFKSLKLDENSKQYFVPLGGGQIDNYQKLPLNQNGQPYDNIVGQTKGTIIFINGNVYGQTRVFFKDSASKEHYTFDSDIEDNPNVSQLSAPVIVIKGKTLDKDAKTDDGQNQSIQNPYAFYGQVKTLTGQIYNLIRVPDSELPKEAQGKYTYFALGWVHDTLGGSGAGAQSSEKGTLNTLSSLYNQSALSLLDRRYQRIGTDALTVEKRHVWGRVLGDYTKLREKTQYGLKLQTYGVQLGHDLQNKILDNNEGSNRTAGILTYLRGDAKFMDYFHVDDKGTPYTEQIAKSHSNMIALGVSHTRDRQWGYMDFVGHVFFNRYHLEVNDTTNHKTDTANAKTYGVALSAEYGHRLLERQNWTLQGQGQAMYTLTHSNALTVDQFNLDSMNNQQLIGRLGLRWSYHRTQPNQVWVTANVLHSFLKNKQVFSDVPASWAKTWYDFGVGTDLLRKPNLRIYATGNYTTTFNAKAKHQGVNASVGLKYAF